MSDLLALLVPPSSKEGLTAEIVSGKALLSQVAPLPVRDEDDAEIMRAVQKAAHDKIAEIEVKRTAITKPLNDAKRAVDALFAPVREPYEALKAACGDKLRDYETAKIALQRAAQEAAKALSAAGDVAGAAVVLESARDEGTSPPRRWRVVGTRVAEMPREFLEPDWKKLNDHMRKWKDSEEIEPLPGVTFEREAVIRVKG